MIRHCVFIKFKDDVNEDHKRQLFADIEALQAHLEGILAVHIGKMSARKAWTKGIQMDVLSISLTPLLAMSIWPTLNTARREPG